jgi:DNA polymerase III subunit gamma/tau
MLSQAAFNAFLKTLAEPPAYAKFILATTEKHKIIPTILSRCQIYDFKRITVNDIAGHLNYVAGAEGIDADPDALQIIAQKSDGALRDALSIFDQIVSFSDGKITYKTVIENLNVLDYDYYFRITDSIMNADYKQTLLLINEIIENGFDGQHFIIGLGEHLRNLLITKDMDTVRLLEASANIQSMYIKQTSRCSVSFLLNALDIINKCDAGYKGSSNKRLTLELALLQMCGLQVAGPAEIPSPPKRVLQESPPVPYAPSGVKKSGAGYGPQSQDSGVVSTGKEGIKTFSIKGPPPVKPDGIPPPGEVMTDVAADAFGQNQLEAAWEKFSVYHQQDKSFYSTLTRRKPVKGEKSTVLFTVDNKIQESELFEKRGDLQGFLRKELNNYEVAVQIMVSENPVIEKPYVPHEKFNYLAEKNPHLKTMKDKFGLEPEYG